MDDLAEIINISIRKLGANENIINAILSFNLVDESLVEWLGLAMPPVNQNDPYYDEDKVYTSIDQSVYASGNIFIAYSQTQNFDKGSYHYVTIVHELGHAIGLAHPHDTGGVSSIFTGVDSAFGDFGDYGANLQPLTIMTYNDTQSPFVPNSAISSGFLSTYGPIDTLCLQFMYGAKTSNNSGNTIYELPFGTSTSKFWSTIWDTGGIDVINASKSSAGVIIDLKSSTIANETNLAGSSLSNTINNNLFGGFTIANNTNIENAIGSSGDDLILGNELNNEIDLDGGGDDIVDGKGGFDTVIVNKPKIDFTINYNSQTSTITMSDNVNEIILKNCEKIIFKEELLISSLEYSQYGSTSCNHVWKTVNFGRSFIDPVVITSDSTYNGSQPVSVRLRNIMPTSFDIRLYEPLNLDVHHATETINYVIGEKGNHITTNNKKITFGSSTSNKLSSSGFENISYNNTFITKPVVLSQIQTDNNPGWMTTRTSDINTTSFNLRLQKEENINNGTIASEQVGWIAIEKVNNDNSINCSETLRVVGSNTLTINFGTTFSSSPILIAKLSSYYGADPVNLRIKTVTTTNFTTFAQEDTTLESEIAHTTETVSYLALDSSNNSL